MTHATSCPQCDSSFSPEETDAGACPRCLIAIGLGKAPAAAAAEDAFSIESLEAIGERIGPYEILDVIGEGGMGVVYLAQQVEPMRRQVALKLIKPGMDTREVLARFETERQALARMNHPGISQVHDAGATPLGRPFFVMELVTGIPITRYCDDRRLDLEERLSLFLQACAAIQHAHQKGIIHRDVKPSNVMVSNEEGRPRVKVIDFGIAKATENHPGQFSLHTRDGLLLGTPQYMSPEQAVAGGRDVDTRTDVYALGLLLYEMLTGALPYDDSEATRDDLEALRRQILEQDPPRPASRVHALGEAASRAAHLRRTDAASLRRRIQGDLDWIVMKALEKDRARRYASAHELAADIERHLRHEPVVAGPPGAGYRTRKFVRRHRVGVFAAALSMTLLLGVTVAVSLQARRIAAERDRANREAEAARQVSRFLVDLFNVSDPGEARGNTIPAREILDQGAAKIESELSGQPELQASLMSTIGSVYSKLGLYGQSAPLLEKALETRRLVLGEDHPDTLRSILEVGAVTFSQGKLPEAEALLREALSRSRRALGEDHPTTLTALSDLGVTLHFQGKLAEAEQIYLEALRRRKQALGGDHPETLETVNNLATLLYAQGRLDEAEPYLRDALEGRRRALGADHPETLDSMINLCPVLMALERLDEAEPVCREALDAGRRIRPDHPKTIVSINNLGKLLALQGRDDEAEAFFREAMLALRRTVGDEHPDTLVAIGNLGDLYTKQGRLREAEALLVPAVGAARRVLPPGHVVTALTLTNYARFLAAAARYEEAEPVLLEAHSILDGAVGSAHRFTRRAVDSLAALYEAWGKPDEAARWRSGIALPAAAPPGRAE